MSGEPRAVYVFDRFRLETAERSLTADGKPIALPPRVFDTLVALVERAGRLVEKDELLKVVWAGVFVDEANISVNISTLRKALGETPDGSSYIETVPRKGYRFVGKVTRPAEPTGAASPDPAVSDPTAPGVGNAVASPFSSASGTLGAALESGAGSASEYEAVTARATHSPSALPAKASARPSRARFAILAGAVLVVATALVASRFRGAASTRPSVKALAVLPFHDAGGTAEESESFFGVGVADALISRLSGAQGIVVRPTSAVFRYVGSKEDPAAIGRALGVDAVVTGLVQRSGSETRVSAQLVATVDGRTFWAQSVREPTGNVFTLQDALAARLAEALTLDLAKDDRGDRVRKTTESREAYELVLRGRFHWFRWNPEGWARAREYYERAIRIDPTYAPAYAGLAEAVGVQGFGSPPADSAPRAKELALQALALDADLAAGHVALGPIQMFYERDWPAAEASFRRALALDPNDPMAHDLLGILLTFTGRLEAGVAQAAKAHALDPRSPYLGMDLGAALFYARRFPEARSALERTLELEPAFFPARFALARVLDELGMKTEAVEEELRGLRRAGGTEESEKGLREAWSRGGTAAFWRARLESLEKQALSRYISPHRIAVRRAKLGDRTGALAALADAERGRALEIVRVGVDPAFESLRNEPAFQELLLRLKLAKP